MDFRDVPDSNLARAGLGQICQNWMDAGPAEAEIWYIPSGFTSLDMLLMSGQTKVNLALNIELNSSHTQILH